MEEWNVSQRTGLTAAESMLPLSAGVWQYGFESQSRYIALRIRAGENLCSCRYIGFVKYISIFIPMWFNPCCKDKYMCKVCEEIKGQSKL